MARFDYIVVSVTATILLLTEAQEKWNLKPLNPKGPFSRLLGSSDFRKMVEEGYPVVDKSEFIREVMESVWETNVIARPRRFGKSVCLSMLKYFLSIDLYSSSIDLFQNFSINKDTTFCNMYKKKFPVINLDLKSGASLSYSSFLHTFKGLVQRQYIKYADILLNSDSLSNEDKRRIKSMCRRSTDEVDHEFGIPDLMQYLHAHYKKRVVVLVDEYDTPAIYSFINGFYSEFMDPFRKIMINIFKNTEHLEKGVIVGITKVAKESIFSAMSNVMMWSVVDEKFSTYFGFLQEEVDWLARRFNLESPILRKQMVQHYNGYLIGNQTIYNPWSVMMCFSHGGDVRDWWIDSGDSEQFYEIMRSYGALPVLKAEFLLRSGGIRQLYKQDLVYTRIKGDENFFWTYITQIGYLTFREVLGEKKGVEEEGIDCFLRIPNDEVKSEFKVVMKSYRNKLNIPDFEDFIKSVKNRKKLIANDILMKYLDISSDAFDGQNKVKTATEIVKGLEVEYGPISKIVEGYDYSLIVMEQPNGTRSIQFLIKTTQNESDLDLKSDMIKDLFKKLGEGVLTKISADYVSYVLVFIYQHHPHFLFAG